MSTGYGLFLTMYETLQTHNKHVSYDLQCDGRASAAAVVVIIVTEFHESPPVL